MGSFLFLSIMGFFICLPNFILAGPCRENHKEFRRKVEPSYAECMVPEGGLPLWQDRTAGCGSAGAAGWWPNKAPEQGAEDDLKVTSCLPGKGHRASPAQYQYMHKHRTGRSSGSVLPWWAVPDVGRLPTDILQYHPSGKSGDGDLRVFLTVQENVFQV